MSDDLSGVIVLGSEEGISRSTMKVGGLTLWERHALAMYHVLGIRTIHLYATDDFEPSGSTLPSDIEFHTGTSLPETNAIVVQGSHVFHKEYLKRFTMTDAIEVALGVARSGKWRSDRSSGPAVDELMFVGVMYVPAGKMRVLSDRLSEDPDRGLVKLAIQTVREGKGLVVMDEALFFVEVTDENSRRRAERLLFASLRKPQDGLIARSINRHLSLPVSRILSYTSLTPNQLSVLNMGFAFLAFVFLVWGNALFGLSWYWSAFLGGLMIQLNSIYDGCDGEIARVKFQYTHFGDWLDTIIDDICNSLFFLGSALWAWQAKNSNLYLYLGLATLALQWTANVMMYHYLIHVAGTGNNQDYKVTVSEGLARLVDTVKYVTKRDFHLFFFFVLSALGMLHVGVFLMFVAALGAASLTVVQHFHMRKEASDDTGA